MKINNLINHSSFHYSNYNILIVEDSKLINDILYNEFSKLGSNCFNSFTLKEANKIINKNQIDYILLDINLPDGNGYELIEKFQNTKTKIFVLSGEYNKKFQEKTYKKGIIDFIIKDHNFFYKIDGIVKSIEKLEKNKEKTILIVDDSVVIQSQLKELLTQRNYNIEVASNIDDAFETIIQKDIHLIILDVEIGSDNGIDFLNKYKVQIISKRKIPVMIISGFVDASVIRKGLSAGAIDVLRKPLISEEIILKVDLWIDYKRKEIEIEDSTKLLNQYKETVDSSSIVSKTDPKGYIVYVNDEFCKVSGYSKEELIGSHHNIIRHEDMGTNHFQEIWTTIKNKKNIWKGKIKNKNKQGNDYWVSTIINPILDSEDNIIEYIAVSNNITEHEDIKTYFKNQLNVSTKNLSHAMNISTEYRRAMNESSIVSRANLEGQITFVNEEFCKISEYSKDELLGQNHNIVKHPEMNKTLFNDLWATIKKGNTWRGIIKNKTKSGKIYWVDSTIVPIKDKNGEILEYMAIRNNLTDFFNLHKEIEHTQKEIIYRMGEISETRSKETGNHVKRVAEYSRLLAKYSNLSDDDVETLFTASPMHDIGKVGVPDSILKKPGKLTYEEFEIMKEHAIIGYNILKGSKRKVLKAAAIVSKEHHEKWNGQGYPQGLKEEEIHIYGRITAVADVFDALGSERCYKKAWEDEKILTLLKEERGKSFDPKLIDLFFEHIDEFILIREKYKD